MKLKGRTAIVTGAARGIGLASAKRMAAEGAQVVMCDILREPLLASVDALKASGYPVVACQMDVTSANDNRRAVELARERFGRIDVFHANAAILQFTPLDSMASGSGDSMIDVNLKGAIHGFSAVLPVMLVQGSGVIVITASVLASVGDLGLPIYGATKGALRALCRSMAVSYGPRGIRCNTISPGDVRTPLFEEFIAKAPDPAQSLQAVIDSYPLQRVAEPDDIARVAVFLASDDAAFITGADIVVDGGLTAQCY